MEMGTNILTELMDNIEFGFNNSVNALLKDIILFMNIQSKNGNKKFRYHKRWQDSGYLMSPVYNNPSQINYSKYNSTKQNENDINKLLIKVIEMLKKEKIQTEKYEYKYIETFNWYYLEFDIILFIKNEDLDEEHNKYLKINTNYSDNKKKHSLNNTLKYELNNTYDFRNSFC